MARDSTNSWNAALLTLTQNNLVAVGNTNGPSLYFSSGPGSDQSFVVGALYRMIISEAGINMPNVSSLTVGSTAAQAGSSGYRTAKGSGHGNGANTGDLPLVSLGSANTLFHGNINAANQMFEVGAAGAFTFWVNGTNRVSLSDSLAAFGMSALAVGTNPAQSGAIRLPRLQFIVARNTADNADKQMIGLDSSDGVWIGHHTGVATVGYSAATTHTFTVGNLTTKMSISSTTVTFADAINLAVGTTTGTKFGTTTTQKLAWWNAAPVIQNTGWSATAGYTTLKSFNPASATFDEALRVLGTLIDTLKTYGMLGA